MLFFAQSSKKEAEITYSGSKFASIEGSRKGVLMSNLNGSDCDSEEYIKFTLCKPQFNSDLHFQPSH
jgi:hypothetical protein